MEIPCSGIGLVNKCNAYRRFFPGRREHAPLRRRYLWALLIAGAVAGIHVGADAQNNDHDQSAVAPGAPEKYYPDMVEGGIELTYPLTPFAFRDVFNGIYGAHISFSQKVFKGLYLGVEAQSSQYSSQPAVPFPIATAAINMYVYGGALKLTFCTAESGDLLFACSLSGGASYIRFNGISGAAPPPPTGGWYGKNVVFYSPRISGGYKVNDQMCISLDITATGCVYTLNPGELGVLQQYSSSQTKGLVTFLQWGFGISYLIGRPK